MEIGRATSAHRPSHTVAAYARNVRGGRVGCDRPEIEGVQVGGMNLFHIVASYNETVSIGVTADRNALPDPSCYADCMQSAFEEMLSAAG
jgi:WS/DGAT C-terminal domain